MLQQNQPQSKTKKSRAHSSKAKEPEIKLCEETLFQSHLTDILKHLQWNFFKIPKDITLTTQLFKFYGRIMIKMLKDSRHVC